MNVLVVNIGNTSATLALARGGRIGRRSRLPGKLGDAAAIARALRRTGAGVRLDGAILASVVPRLNPLWQAGLKRATGRAPLLVTHRLRLGVGLDLAHPERVGADRLADVAGAVARHGAPVIVADFGTALTLNVVTRAGTFIGGIIAPGWPLMTEYLADRTALLPRIAVAGRSGAVGRDTVPAMRIGARVGYRGLVRELVGHLRRELRLPRARLCATGGYARVALRGAGLPFRIEPDLTLFGLARIYELNAGKA